MSRAGLCQTVLILGVLLPATTVSHGDSVDIPASKDNTVYAPSFGRLISNGAGIYTFSGNTALPPPKGDIRRAVMAFDITGHVPAGASIGTVTLTLHMSKTIASDETVELHRLTADWGEGASIAPGEEGGGTDPTPGDVTWQHRFFPDTFWTNVGGDFSPVSSAGTTVTGVGFYTWESTAQMVADVQSWLDVPAGNFGWILIGNEAAPTTVKRFDSRENPTPENQPKLTVVFTPALDCNHNGVPDAQDILRGTSKDCNRNGVPDECDIAAGTSRDMNGNGVPDECEADCNHNGIPDAMDVANGRSRDCNRNGIPDECDIAAGTSRDTDANGIPDECEADCNHNGHPDAEDLAAGTSRDCNHNGVPDECDIASGHSTDLNGDSIPDECEPDCNDNGVPDAVDLTQGTSQDCNHNGIPDECDIAAGTSRDRNRNGVPDECEQDCNGNGVPDDVDIARATSPDCNQNGIPDECDLAAGTSQDCNGNGVPDECDLASGTNADCNANDIPDECDIAAQRSRDVNHDGVPDECQHFPPLTLLCGALHPLTIAGAVAGYGTLLVARRRKR